MNGRNIACAGMICKIKNGTDENTCYEHVYIREPNLKCPVFIENDDDECQQSDHGIKY